MSPKSTERISIYSGKAINQSLTACCSVTGTWRILKDSWSVSTFSKYLPSWLFRNQEINPSNMISGSVEHAF